MINLISDTVTQPSKEMRVIMAEAIVGDDVFREDPTINELEEFAAQMFGMEAALYCPSGTMTNQIAIQCHTRALDEMICDINSHVYQYETSGYAYHSRVGIHLIDGVHGKINANQLEKAINPDFDWLANSRLVVLENSCNRAGGSFYTVEEIRPITLKAKEHGLSIHLDGARLFNVLVETLEDPKEYGQLFDSISICTSKGLGAPVGSLLIGNKAFIKRARKLRKVFGGGMRQAGIIAAGSLYALKNNIGRLAIDNKRAKEIGATLEQLDYVLEVFPVQTNIVVFKLKGLTAQEFVDRLNSNGVLAKPISPDTMRLVTHLDYTEDMHVRFIDILQNL